MFALLIAVQDRKKHNITDMPALNNIEFRHSFVDASCVTLALENNTDLIAAADAARNSFSHIVGAGCPLERTLAGTTVVVDVNTDVGVTHVGGDSMTATVANEDRGLAGMSLDADPATHGHSGVSRGEDSSSLPSASSGRADARREANASDARPCSYSDVRLGSHSDHGDAAAGPPDLVSWVAAPGRGASTSAASSSAAPTSGLPTADPGRPSYEGRLRTFLANHLPPAPPQTSAEETVRRRGRAQMQMGRPECERAAEWRPTIQGPKSTPPRPSTGQASSSTASGHTWSETPYGSPWNNADRNTWQEKVINRVADRCHKTPETCPI